MSTVEQRRVGAYLARHFSGGSGPSHADLSIALGICGYQESPDIQGRSKQNRVVDAFQNATREQAVCFVRELLTMLLAGVDFDNLDESDYRSLMDTLSWADLKLAQDSIFLEHRVIARSAAEPNTSRDDLVALTAGDIEPRSPHAVSETQEMACNVFISHSTTDSSLALQVARYVRTSCNLPEEMILCTSAPNFGLPAGAGWSDALRNALVDSALVVFLLSEDFLESRFCGYEMGAVWIAKEPKQIFPIRLAGVDADILGSLAGTWQAPELSSIVLQQLAERVTELQGKPAPRASLLSQQVEEFFPGLA